MNTITRPAERLAEAVRYATGIDLSPADDMVFLEPRHLRCIVETAVAGAAGRVRVAGTLDRRLVCVERRDGQWVVRICLDSRTGPACAPPGRTAT
jgi:hypothetical protein